MALSTGMAKAPDHDLAFQGQCDDGQQRRPIADWLQALPDISDAAPIKARLAAMKRQPNRRPGRAEPILLATPTLPSETTAAPAPFRTAEPAPPAPAAARPEPAPASETSRRAVPRGVTALVAGCAALILGLAVYIGVTTNGAAPQAAELGDVVVSSHPSGALVLLYGVEQGTTPLVLRLATGRHRLEIAGAGGARQPLDTDVVAGRSVSHHVELLAPTSTSGDSTLIIDTGDPVAQLSIDGKPAGATPLASTRVTPGRHAVRVRYRGGVTVERQVIVPAGETVSLVLDQSRSRPAPPVPPAAPISGWVRVNAPFQVDVFERGQLVGSSGLERILLETGPRTLELVNTALGFQGSVTTHVTAGKVADVVVETPRAPVAINAQPWAQVIVDGKAHGDTPIANLILPIGNHRVVLRHPELGERVQMVTVRADGVNRVSADLRR